MSRLRDGSRRGSCGAGLTAVPFLAGLGAGAVLALLSGARSLSDLLFCAGSGFLIAALVRTLSNLRMFASFSWGTRMLKRLFTGEARSGREETEDYARYRAGLGGHRDAPLLWAAAVILLALAALTAWFA